MRSLLHRKCIGEYGVLAVMLAGVALHVASACTTTGSVGTDSGSASGSQVSNSLPSTPLPSGRSAPGSTAGGANPLAAMVGTFTAKFAAVGCAIGDEPPATTTAKWAWNYESQCPDVPTIDPFSIVSSVTVTETSIEVQVPTRASTCTGTPSHVRTDGPFLAAFTLADVRCGGEAAPDVYVTLELKDGDLYANGKQFHRAGTNPGARPTGTPAPSATAPRSKFSAVASAIR